MTHREAIAEGERVGSEYLLVPPRTVLSGAMGARIGGRSGGSLEFRDHRDYEPGDDLRHLDWSIFARTDRLTVKQYHEEISLFLDLIVDGSRSMALGVKARAALGLAALFASAARTAGLQYALRLARAELELVSRGAARPTEWRDFGFDYAGTPAAAVAAGGGTLRPLSVRVFISDLLWPGEPQAVAAALGHGAAAVVIVQLMAADEVDPDLRGGWRLVDVESGDFSDVLLDAGALSQYRAALARHRALWDDAARGVRALVVRGVAEEVGRQLVFDELAAADILRPA